MQEYPNFDLVSLYSWLLQNRNKEKWSAKAWRKNIDVSSFLKNDSLKKRWGN